MNDLCMVFLSYVMMMIVMVMMIWWLFMYISSMRDCMTWCCCLCLNHLCCISEEYKLSYYLVVLRRMIYIAFTYIHVCMLVHSHIYFISCIKHQLSLHNARMVHSIHMHCRIHHHNKYHYYHVLITTIIILDIIISTIFIFYFSLKSHLFISIIVWMDCSPLGQYEW